MRLNDPNFSRNKNGNQVPKFPPDPGWTYLEGQKAQAELAKRSLAEQEAWKAYDAEFDRCQEAGRNPHDDEKVRRLFHEWVEAKKHFDFWSALVHGKRQR